MEWAIVWGIPPRPRARPAGLGESQTLEPTSMGLGPLEGPLKASELAQAGALPGRVAAVWREAQSRQLLRAECCLRDRQGVRGCQEYGGLWGQDH